MVERRATYRVQLHAGFPFSAAADVAGYLADLGVSHMYCSPYLQAAAGSTHGYDVVDPQRVSGDLGGAAGHRALGDALRSAGLLQLLDIVPNHMSTADPRNRWWQDVLEDGRGSPYADLFDIDWESPLPGLAGRVLLPVLGDHLGRVVGSGELRLACDAERVTLRYFDASFPLAAHSLIGLLEGAEAGPAGEVVRRLRALPGAAPKDSRAAEDRAAHRRRASASLAAALGGGGREAIEEAVGRVNADPDRLLRLVDSQHYRLAHWRLAAGAINYRRFFDINTLVALRVEDEGTFAATHELILRLVRDGSVDGLRIDHVDGLRRPAAYLDSLRAAVGEACWLVVEKILEAGETLPDDWPVQGTTGYDFAARVGGLLVDGAAEQAMTDLYADLCAATVAFDRRAREAKREVMDRVLRSDVSRLARLLADVCRADPDHRDHDARDLRAVLVEVIAAITVYRTYVDGTGSASAGDQRVVTAAVETVRRERPDIDGRLLDVLLDTLLGHTAGGDGAPGRELALRLQQVSSAVTAKGVEDTAFYRHHRLVALNEVGGDPGRFGTDVAAFHDTNRRVQERWPSTVLATSTHDTKRSEDVRARIAVLSEMPDRWGRAVRRWMERNERHRRGGLPDRGSEYLLYQTLVGAHPLPADRAVAYMEKASREAKQHTSWTEPDPAFDAALRGFVEGVVADGGFAADLEAFMPPVIEAGRVNSLAQTLLKLCAPGVPDIYQGTELWDLSLVDPDNRRPVDYQRRRTLLARVAGMGPEEAMREQDSGLPKLLVIQRALRLRRERPQSFDERGAYTPLEVTGPRQDHLVAFSRGEDAGVVALVPRLTVRLGGRWEGTAVAVPPGRWLDRLSGAGHDGGMLPAEAAFARFPVALLSRVR